MDLEEILKVKKEENHDILIQKQRLRLYLSEKLKEEWFITKNTDKKNFIVFNQKMAGYLMQRGFVLIDMQPDLKKTGRNIFLFNDTPQLKSAINEYMSW